MCGIAAILCGIRITNTNSSCSWSSLSLSTDDLVNDLKEALRRRGPDTLGTHKLHLNDGNAELLFIGATLQLRGTTPIKQPLLDSSRNLLLFNGEIFGGGVHVPTDTNDAQALLDSLQAMPCITSCVSSILGPWAFIYWQETTRTLWFGRDAFGRRSLLVHWPTPTDPRLILSSVSTDSPTLDVASDFEGGDSDVSFWEELPCGVYSLSIKGDDECMSGEIKKQEWANPELHRLIKWDRESVEPKPEDIHSNYLDKLSYDSVLTPAERVRSVLKESVMRRTTMTMQAPTCDSKIAVPIAVLFSGGLDSMILAALLDECLEARYEIDLLNVSFDGRSAPDRISARDGIKELERISPLRRWRLVEIDAELSKLGLETKHVMSLINPAKTYMDLNIGIALWLAASGDGWVNKTNNHNEGDDDSQRVKYKSEARILLVGSGADEQCGGYGRHRTKFKAGSWLGLDKEMKLDMQRIWKRNLGRDDRCLSDNGKEARFPFLDEDVIRTLLDIPLWNVVDLNQPSGCGDKKILREVARLLGLNEAATLPKRAIQFGSRIARESNRKNYGSNRAANQASAGSAKIKDS